MKPKVKIHTSDIRRYKKCRRLWHFASLLRLGRTPQVSPMYFIRGRAFHKAFEAFHKYNADPVEAFEEALADEFLNLMEEVITPTLRAKYNEILEVGISVLSMYPRWFEANPFFDELVDAETSASVPLIEGADFSFRADLVVRIDGKLWLVDFKTVSQRPSEKRQDYLLNDEQITGYLHACETVYDEPFVGAIFIFVLAKSPSEPKILKSGELSKSKNQNVSAMEYRDLLQYLGLKSEPYEDYLQYLETERQWFFVSKVIRSTAQKQQYWKELKCVAREMLDEDETLVIYPNPSQTNCIGCSYFDPCLTWSQGRYASAVRTLEKTYKKARDW